MVVRRSGLPYNGARRTDIPILKKCVFTYSRTETSVSFTITVSGIMEILILKRSVLLLNILKEMESPLAIRKCQRGT